ncbi:MAG: alpha/beta hydrolase, partial [Parasphingopyxis sp.]
MLTLLLSSLLVWPAQAQLSRFENIDPPPHMPDDYVIDFREYGDETRQTLTYSCSASEEPRPLLVYLDEGYWADGQDASEDDYLAPYALDRGYCHVDVRTRQNAKVDEALEDIVAALFYMRENVEEIGHDPTRIVLVGRGSAATIAALIGTDPRYLRSGGFDFDILRGVILLEPEALDIGARAAASRRLRESYFPEFYGV